MNVLHPDKWTSEDAAFVVEYWRRSIAGDTFLAPRYARMVQLLLAPSAEFSIEIHEEPRG